MEAEVTGKVQKLFGRKVAKVASIGFIVILILGALFLLYFFKFKTSSNTSVQQQTATVRKGNISVTLSGSGTISSSNRVEVAPAVNGTVTKVYFKEGDTVKAGDPLCDLDNTDAQLNVEKMKNQILQTQLNVKSGANSPDNLMVTAPFDGVVTNVTVKVGDDVGKNANIMNITDQATLKLQVPFNGVAVKGITPGAKATVYIQSLMQSVEGTVTYVGNSSFSTSAGGELYNVEVTVNNPGALKEGMKASVEVNTPDGIQSSTDVGQLSYINTKVIKSATGGTVQQLNVRDNQYVKSGDLLVQLKNDDLQVTNETNELKLQDLQNQLNTAQKQLENYKITAPIDGVIVKQDIIVGDKVSQAKVISTIVDSGHMEFAISVDELDIAKIKVGQKAGITLDALAETATRPLSGEVSKIALEGSSSNGVTTYPVTVKIDNSENIKEGMNANAEIDINSKSDILVVPIEAVQKIGNRAMVWVQTDEKTAKEYSESMTNGGRNGFNQNGNNNRSNGDNNSQGNRNNNNGNRNSNGDNQNMMNSRMRNNLQNSYYKNAIPKQVEVGINNDSYIEIISGLNEGDKVILPQVSTGTGQNMTNRQDGFGGIGGMGGFGGGGQRVISGGNGGGNNNNSRNNNGARN